MTVLEKTSAINYPINFIHLFFAWCNPNLRCCQVSWFVITKISEPEWTPSPITFYTEKESAASIIKCFMEFLYSNIWAQDAFLITLLRIVRFPPNLYPILLSIVCNFLGLLDPPILQKYSNIINFIRADANVENISGSRYRMRVVPQILQTLRLDSCCEWVFELCKWPNLSTLSLCDWCLN